MRRRAVALATLATLAASTSVRAQVVEIRADQRVGEVPTRDGEGVPVRWVRGYFAGFPFHIDDARDLLDGTAVVPAFDVWCGALPYIDFGNRAAPDSLGRGAPTMLCPPFLDPDQTAEVTCRSLPGVPAGRYWQNGGAAMRARGGLAVREAGVYTFAWGHDDGVALRVGATRVYEFPDGTAPRVDVAVVRFEAPGLYPFVLEWFDGVGGAVLDWYVARGERAASEFSGEAFALVRTEDLYALDAQDCTARCEPCALPTPRCDRAAGRCVRCLRDADCGRCAACRDGACLPLSEVPGADGGGACAPIAREDPVDVITDDLGLGAPAAGAPRAQGGCACATSAQTSRGPRLALLLALVVGWRRWGRRR